MKKIIIILLTVVSLISYGKVEFVDSYGRNFYMENVPQRVISLGPAITEILYSLGCEENIIARTDYCDYPEIVQNKPSVGAIMNPSIEKIVDLKPDLIISSVHVGLDVLKKIESLGIKTLPLYGDNNYETTFKNIRMIGEVLGVSKRADRVVESMKNELIEIERKVKNQPKPKVYYVVSFGQYGDFTAGGDTYIHEIITTAGGNNIAKELKGWKYSIEKIIENDPDIIVVSKYYGMKSNLMNDKIFSKLRAVKNGDVYEIDNNKIDRQGPRLVDGVRDMAKIFHPGMFENENK